MATRTLRQEREFGLLVGAITSAIGGWWLYRGRFGFAARPMLLVGLSLVVLGVLFPGALRYPYRVWMRLAEGISFVMTRLTLAIVFFGIVTPIGLLRSHGRGSSAAARPPSRVLLVAVLGPAAGSKALREDVLTGG